jgi:hypothetical protein
MSGLSIEAASRNLQQHQKAIMEDLLSNVSLTAMWVAAFSRMTGFMEIKEFNKGHAFGMAMGFMGLQHGLESLFLCALCVDRGEGAYNQASQFAILAKLVSTFITLAVFQRIANRYHVSVTIKKWVILPLMFAKTFSLYPDLVGDSLRKSDQLRPKQ